ncbi:MAG: hypothetical protein K9L85_04245 [Candidatus Peribacteraceae bacterium]|nr:hypothetical protein [Candidatus Peribacteraceae bacterium]
MENRLIFFASPTEQQEGAETSKSEQGSNQLQQAADDYARAKISAERGGHTAVADAERISQDKSAPEFTRLLMKNGAKKVKDAVAERNKNPTPEATTKLNAAVVELKNKIINFEKRKLENAAAESEIKQLSALPNAEQLFKDLKITLHSKSKGGSVDFKWKPGAEGVSSLGLEQKKLLAKKMHEQISQNPEGGKALESLRDNLLGNPDVPQSWKKWLKNPEAGFTGATDKQKNLGYVVEWIMKNLGELKAQTSEFSQISSQADANPQAAKELSEKGVRTSIDRFRELSRTERNEVLKNYSNVLASTNADLAERAAKAGVSEGVEAEHVKTKNTAEIAKAKKETAIQAEQLSTQLQDFASSQKLSQKAAARERELAEAGKEAGTADQVANLRQRAQAGESVGLSEKMKNLFRFGKKTAADDYPDAKKEEDFAARARREVASEELENPKNLDEFSKSLGLKGVQKEEAAKLSQLLALEKFDAENVRGQLTPEMKALLARRAADDYAEKKAA